MLKKPMKDTNQQATTLVASVIGREPPTGVYEALLKRRAAAKKTKAKKK